MRYLEIDANGMAFHEPGFDHPFSTGDQVPPDEVIFCDCAGIGRICHHVYAAVPDHDDAAKRVDRHVSVNGRKISVEHQDEWKQAHAGPRHQHRRQFFVDVTHRPDAQIGMRYDEATDTFSAVPVET